MAYPTKVCRSESHDYGGSNPPRIAFDDVHIILVLVPPGQAARAGISTTNRVCSDHSATADKGGGGWNYIAMVHHKRLGSRVYGPCPGLRWVERRLIADERVPGQTRGQFPFSGTKIKNYKASEPSLFMLSLWDSNPLPTERCWSQTKHENDHRLNGARKVQLASNTSPAVLHQPLRFRNYLRPPISILK